jgi:hypothetical protein
MIRRLPLPLQAFVLLSVLLPTAYGFWTWSGAYATLATWESQSLGAYHPALCFAIALLVPLAIFDATLRLVGRGLRSRPPPSPEEEARQTRWTMAAMFLLVAPGAALFGAWASQPDPVTPMSLEDAPYGAPPWTRLTGEALLAGTVAPGPRVRTDDGTYLGVAPPGPEGAPPARDTAFRMFLYAPSEEALRTFVQTPTPDARMGHLLVGGLPGAARLTLAKDGYNVAPDHLVFAVGAHQDDAQQTAALALGVTAAGLLVQGLRTRPRTS